MSYVGEWVKIKKIELNTKTGVSHDCQFIFYPDATGNSVYLQEVYMGMGQAVVRFRGKSVWDSTDDSERIVSIPYHNINYLYYEIAEQEVNNKV